MKKPKKIIAIIPARGGSKGIPDKNIKNFCGKPLIAWTIIEAQKSKLIDRVIVSTDSEKIAEIALQYRAEVPFLRPKNLAEDTAPIEPVLKHAVEWLKKNENYKTDLIVWLLLTNPLRSAKDIDEAIKISLRKNPDTVVSVSPLSPAHNPFWVFEFSKTNNKRLVNAKGQYAKYIPARRQDLPPFYVKNDMVYVLKPKVLYGKKPHFIGNTQELYKMSDFYDADINTPEEWMLMENKFKHLKKDEIK